MKLYDLEKLVRDDRQDNLYNFFDPTFQFAVGLSYKQFVVGPEQAMRIDLVCFEIYKTVDQVDFLLDLNNIDNPLNIMEDDIIIYAAEGAIDEFRLINNCKEI